MKTAGLHFILTWILIQGFPSAHAATAVVPVEHRLPKKIVQLITPVLEPGEGAVALDAGVLIKAGEKRIDEIQILISQLDRPLKNLIVTVLQSHQATLEQLNNGAKAAIHLPEATIQEQGFWHQSRSAHSRDIWQSLKILEGRPAFIAVGRERPVPVLGVYGYPPRLAAGIEYQPVTQGFRVLPTMAGCKVRLDISPWAQNLKGNGDIATQTASTTVEAKLGQWIELGNHDVRESHRSSQLTGHRYSTGQDQIRVFLKVEAQDGCP